MKSVSVFYTEHDVPMQYLFSSKKSLLTHALDCNDHNVDTIGYVLHAHRCVGALFL